MHAQIARRAKHILILLGIKNTQEVHRQQEPASDYANTEGTSALKWVSREMAMTPGGRGVRKREKYIYACSDMHTRCLRRLAGDFGFTSGRPTTDNLPASELHLLYPPN